MYMQIVFKFIFVIDLLIYTMIYLINTSNRVVIILKKVIIDYRTSEEEKNSLLKLGYEILICPPSKDLYYSVCGHPDMLLHITDNKSIILHKDIPQTFIESLSGLGLSVFLSNSSLHSNYPLDIILNAVTLPNYFIHYLDYTDKNLLNIVNTSSKKLIKVKQGYTKCSTAIVTNNAIITSDKGIASALISEGIDVLLIPPGDIDLPGLNYGFIGGCCGLLEKNLLAFYGSLEYYKHGEEILRFLKKHNVEPVFLRNGKLIDRGSILRI